MKVKRLATFLTALLLGASSLAMAATIGERVDIAQQRIEQGIRSGSLTRDEARRLRDELSQVRHDESRALRDGRLDRNERERLNSELNRLERHISQLKNNDQQRRDRRY
jgi:polyhydroxyalkanoate synthesis regulator phasin